MNLSRLISVLTICSLAVFSFSSTAQAAAKKRGGRGAFAGGSLSAGIGYAITTADQTGINSLIGAAKNNAASTASTLGSATEFVGHFTFTFANGYVALQLRPSIFSQSS